MNKNNKSYKNGWKCHAILLLIVCIVLCGTSNAFDLSQAYSKALSYNANFLASLAKNLASHESQVQSVSLLKPQINATGAMTENYLNSGGGSLFYHQPTAGLQLQQVIFDFSKFSSYSKSKYITKVADLDLELAKQQLVLDVAQSYFDVLYAEDTVAAINISKDFFEKQYIQAKKSFDAGVVTIADVNDAKSSYDAALADEIKAQNDLINKKNVFYNLTGLDANNIQPLVKDIILKSPVPNSVNKWSSIAKVDNVNVKIAHIQVKMAHEDVNIATAGHMPNLNANADYQYQGVASIDGTPSPEMEEVINVAKDVPGTFLSEFSIGTASVQLSVPVYSGGMVSSQVRQAKNNYTAAKHQLVSTERQTDQQTRNAFWQVENGVSLVKAQMQALKSAQLKLKSDQTGYKVGIRNSVDLVSSQKNYYQALQNYNQSRYQYLNARLKLEFLAGKINSKFLKSINLNVQQH